MPADNCFLGAAVIGCDDGATHGLGFDRDAAKTFGVCGCGYDYG